MNKLFDHLPLALHLQVVLRGVVALLFFVLFIALWAVTKEFAFALPCLLFATFLFENTALMLYNMINGNFVCIHGICSHIERSGIRKRVRSIVLSYEGQQLLIPVHRPISGLTQGCGVTLYLSDKSTVYERNGRYIIDSYYTLILEEG